MSLLHAKDLRDGCRRSDNRSIKIKSCEVTARIVIILHLFCIDYDHRSDSFLADGWKDLIFTPTEAPVYVSDCKLSSLLVKNCRNKEFM